MILIYLIYVEISNILGAIRHRDLVWPLHEQLRQGFVDAKCGGQPATVTTEQETETASMFRRSEANQPTDGLSQATFGPLRQLPRSHMRERIAIETISLEM